MRRNRFKHYVDTFPKMFRGMRTYGNEPEFAALGSGKLEVDVLNRRCVRDGIAVEPLPYVFSYMFEWFHGDLAKNAIPLTEISSASLIIDLVIGKWDERSGNLEMGAKCSARLSSGSDVYCNEVEYEFFPW